MYLFPTPFCPARPYALQTAHTYSSELLAAMTLLTRPDLWHPVPASRPPGPSSPGAVHAARSRIQPDFSQYGAILGQGGSWEDAGKVRVGREGGGFSAHDYVSQALWMPPRAQGCHKEEHTHHRLPPQPSGSQRQTGAGMGLGLPAPISVAAVGRKSVCLFAVSQQL